MIRKVLKWSVLVVLCLFFIAQFYRPARTNPVSDGSQLFESHLQIDPKTAAILDRSCVDCHSNKTRWPWYSNVAPVSWFVIDHVDHGRSHLNFSEWGKYDRQEQRALLTDICKEVKQGTMPLSSYTPLHPGSKLTLEDIHTVCDWANGQRGKVDERP
jgi:hypothetical protein